MTEIIEKLKDKFPLPTTNKAFHIALKKEFDEYLGQVKDLTWENIKQNADNNVDKNKEHTIPHRRFISIAKSICKRINDAIYDVRNGMPNEAYQKIEKILQIPELDKYLYDNTIKSTHKTFYRLRKMNPDIRIQKNEIKHCPFESVHKLGNFRFSLSGFPCLYLGSSIDVCKKEIGFNPNSSYCHGTFEIKSGKNIRLLNICPFDNKGKIRDELGFLLLYPLYLSCLTKKQCTGDAHFYEEYIIPQLLLLYVRMQNEKDKNNPEKQINGIRYLSTYYEKGQDVLDMMNYVFPVTQIKDSGYDDELLDNFDIKVVLHQENTAQ